LQNTPGIITLRKLKTKGRKELCKANEDRKNRKRKMERTKGALS
jgi:hypothetical protein